jgi:hypothetical protein
MKPEHGKYIPHFSENSGVFAPSILEGSEEMEKLASLTGQTMEVGKYLFWKPELGIFLVHLHCFVEPC